ncbi:hypothetical protein MNU23_30830 [Pseudomonas aeruginosa]|nr:hypothetical protein [Pseudomonas aeruginosa]MCT2416074.1 hypothetical protein [Pseudomonas aeruginosa]
MADTIDLDGEKFVSPSFVTSAHRSTTSNRLGGRLPRLNDCL